ncbi:uncharacterized protein ColSpa_03172 [Colletotrichum spaethianum]|uniref:Small secreted protein n=1 Tax=Colletotrichum spaethianum TaxID=700344 RepID=A0AA37L727_9PEZI|nr:uncharacterized protein ColSpa_03172 [Colletotrichum spaethianum]GKT42991.1 hypothetical protein ColSpa_03172 [Colletotrichum spaethianum]
MRYSQLILSLFLFVTFAIALPMPAPVESVVARANGNKGGGKATPRKRSKKQEKQDTKAVAKAEKGGNFNQAKGKLSNDIKEGQKVRGQNQQNADKKNTALVKGLDKVQGAQAKEAKQTASLKGGNTAADKKTLKALQGEIGDGIKQNKANEKAAKAGSKKGN